MYLVRKNLEEICLAEEPHDGHTWTINIGEQILGAQFLTVVDQVGAQAPWTWQPRYSYDLEPLKSNFQKCMRQQCLEACMATAKHLLGQEPLAFLRRLAVVLLEDSLLCVPAYAQVIWLMLACGKGYKLSQADAQLVMDAVATGLMSQGRYDLEAEAPEAAPKLEGRLAYVLLMVRAQMGGMKCDAEFLKRLAGHAGQLELPVEHEISSLDLEEIPVFSVADHMLPAAIDFHCCRQLLEAVRLETGVKLVTAKEAIWWHRSSINVRTAPQAVVDREEGARFRTCQTWSRIASTVTTFTGSKLQVLEAGRQRVVPQTTLDTWLQRRPKPEQQ